MKRIKNLELQSTSITYTGYLLHRSAQGHFEIEMACNSQMAVSRARQIELRDLRVLVEHIKVPLPL